MIVDAGNVRNILEKLVDHRGNFWRRHAGAKFARFRRFFGDRLHRQMKHDLESAAMCFVGNVYGMFVIGQDGNREGIAQREHGVGSRAVAAEIINNDREPRVLFSNGVICPRAGCGCGGRHDFNFDGRHSRTSKLEVQKLSRLNGRVLRQTISRRGAVKTLKELRDRGTVRV